MMTKTALFTLVAILALALGFSACGGDDTDPNPPTTDGSIDNPTTDNGLPTDPNACKATNLEVSIIGPPHNSLIQVCADGTTSVQNTIFVSFIFQGKVRSEKLISSLRHNDEEFTVCVTLPDATVTPAELSVSLSFSGETCNTTEVTLLAKKL